MSETTHYFAANVPDPQGLKELLVREQIPAMIDLCDDYEYLGRGKWDDLPRVRETVWRGHRRSARGAVRP